MSRLGRGAILGTRSVSLGGGVVFDRYRAEHGIEGTWEARERVDVALTGGPEGDTLIRRAARIAERAGARI